jgi:hypothetical protein
MSRKVFVWRDGGVVDRSTVGPLHPRRAAPMIRTDGMSAMRSMADGRIYDGKSAYYASVRRAGCEIVGNESTPFERRPTHDQRGIGAGVGADIKRAIEQLESR